MPTVVRLGLSMISDRSSGRFTCHGGSDMLTEGQRALLAHLRHGRVLGPAPQWNDDGFEFTRFRCDGPECAELFSRNLLAAIPATLNDVTRRVLGLWRDRTPLLSHEWILTEAGRQTSQANSASQP